jgi:DNA polymerase III delta prime subunit
MNLHEILLKKAATQELGHFYIVETSAPESISHKKLLTFVHEFIRDYYQKIEGHKQSLAHLMDHPDVYVLGNLDEDEDDKKDKSFKVEQAEALSRFFEFKPVMGKRKFAVITEGHRITNIVANKWLKLFEEPQGLSTIFLLNPRRGKLLPTIHSRALHLRLPTKSDPLEFSEWNELISDLQKMTLSQFLENYSRGERDLTFWVNELIRWESEQLDSSAPKEALETWLKELGMMETFHQPTATKWSLFYSYLRESVLPRL